MARRRILPPARKVVFAFAPALAAVIAAAALLFSCASVPPADYVPPVAGAWSGTTVAATAGGVVQGERDKKDTFVWRGLPYAAPPVGELRWEAPRPVQPWEGIRPAKNFGNRSMQRASLTNLPSGSEDSLYLNVWRPATAEKQLPVYIWIHGGGNTSGASNAVSDYFGHALAAKANLVFVSVNYRLDVFGWFAHPALREGEPESDSGNFCTLDLIAALKWVRDNIASFGGDPGNVTIAGGSAGAFNVLTLLMAPAAKGLFHKAIAESGYTHGLEIEPEAYAEDLALKLAIRQGKAKNEEQARAFLASMDKASTVAWLKAASAGDLLAVAKPETKAILALPYPVFDGHVLPAEGFAALAKPELRADVPLIIGTNKEETKFFLAFWGENSRDPLYQELAETTSALWKAEGADAVADAFDKGAALRKVYLYRFDWGAPDERGKSVQGGRTGAILGASHAMEMPFFLQTDTIFGNYLPLRIFTGANKKGRLDLQSKIGDYLSAFVRTGDPNGFGATQAAAAPGVAAGAKPPLLYWKPWSADEPEPFFIVFDADFNQAKLRLERGRIIKKDWYRLIETEASPKLKAKLEQLRPLFR